MADTEALALRPEEAARLLGTSRSKVYLLVAAGELPSVRLGARGVRIPLGALRQWLEEHTTAAVS